MLILCFLNFIKVEKTYPLCKIECKKKTNQNVDDQVQLAV